MNDWKLDIEKPAGKKVIFYLRTGWLDVDGLRELIDVIDGIRAVFVDPEPIPEIAVAPEHVQHSELEIPSSAQSDETCIPEPAPTTEQKNGGEPMLGAEPAAVTLPITEPEQMPVIERSSHDVATEKSRVERNRLVTLRDKESGLYLNLDGTGTTVDVSNAYRGTERQAATMRQRSEHAKGMNIYTFTQRTK